jgi:hypothetical protein
MNFLFTPPSSNDLDRLLKAWRFWLLAALIGGLLGAAIHFIVPPPYRARASVLVDFNVEEAYTATADKQIFYYLEREVRKLEAIAWSDAVLQVVADKVGGVTVSELRESILLLSQPGEADWHFWAEDRDPQRAAALASAWAEAFTAQVQQAAAASLTLQSYHATIESGCGADCAGLESKIAGLEARAQGISPYAEVGLVQADDLPVTRKIAVSTYILVGAVVAWALGALGVLFITPWKKGEINK